MRPNEQSGKKPDAKNVVHPLDIMLIGTAYQICAKPAQQAKRQNGMKPVVRNVEKPFGIMKNGYISLLFVKNVSCPQDDSLLLTVSK